MYDVPAVVSVVYGGTQTRGADLAEENEKYIILVYKNK